MKSGMRLLVGMGISVMAVALAPALAPTKAATRDSDAVLATPPGITLQPLGKAQGYDLGKMSAASLPRDEIAYTNAKGLTLYVYEKDQSGKSFCVAECAKSWIPLAAAANAEAFGPWSVITRDDGSRQWALRGKPLYTFVKDVDPGSVHGNSPARTGARRLNGAGVYVGGGTRGGGVKAAPDEPLPSEWRVALLYPAASDRLPVGISIKEVADANALVLIDSRDRTLYAFSGDPKHEMVGDELWFPLAAPQLADPIGDFGFVKRPDGIRQWSYKGKGLYTFGRDQALGDAYGVGVDKLYDVAAVVRYFTPSDVSVSYTASQGKVLATKSGMTLYRRDGYIFQSGGGHSLRRGQPPRPAVGRDIGTNARCAEACGMWHPFKAPDDAQPQGFWNVGTREDGSKQWLYQGYALWTFDGDKKPGDMNGNDSYDFFFSTERAPEKMLEVPTPSDGVPGLYWIVAVP